MAGLKALSAIIVLLLTLPIWFYLLYKILQAVNASDLMWFLFWVYVPASFIAVAIGKAVEAIGE